MNDKTKPEAQAAGEVMLLPMPSKLLNAPHPVDHMAIREYAMACVEAALPTAASHDAQQDTSPEYRRGWLAGVESMRQELAQQPAVDDPEGSLRWLDRRIADMGGHDKTTETYQHYVNLRSMIRAQQPAVVGDAEVARYWRDRAQRAEALSFSMSPGPGPQKGCRLDAAGNPMREVSPGVWQSALAWPDAALTPAATPGEGPVSASDWRDLYRLQTAMRYMDCNVNLTRETAYSMADADIGRIEANAQKEGNGNG